MPADAVQPDFAALPAGVHLCQRGPQGALPSTLIGATPVLLLMLGACTYAGWQMLGGVYWMPPAVRATLLTVAVLAAAALIVRAAARSYHRAVTHPGVPYAPDPEIRVNIALDAEQKAALMPLEDTHLEPERFTAFAPDFGPLRSVATRLQAKLGDHAWVLLAPVWVTFIFVSGPASVVVFSILLAVLGVGTLLLFRRPTELLVTPGRVDLVRHPLRSSGRTDVERFDLRSGPILVDMRARRVVLDPLYERPPVNWKTGQEWWARRKAQERTLSLALVPRAEQALLAIARAAVSTAEPPHPEDAPAMTEPAPKAAGP